jgi:N-acetylglucosaminyl-diphospho-decaprenol L-rhamnosyltransferase
VTEEAPARKNKPDITVVLVNYNTGHLFNRLFTSLEAARGNLIVQLIVVDNASRDQSVTILRSKYPDVEVIENANNVGFGRANNQAIQHALGKYVLLLNTDAFVSSDTLRKTINFMEAHPKCGVLGVKLVGEDGSAQPGCRTFPTPWNTFLLATGLDGSWSSSECNSSNPVSLTECDWVTGCYYLVRKTVIDQIGLFDPRYFMYFEEVDHCRRVRQSGWKIVYYPDTEVVHLGGESAKSQGPITVTSQQVLAFQVESELLYFRKYHGFLGVLAAAILETVSDLLNGLKGVLNSKGTARGKDAMHHLKLLYKLLVGTRLGSRPTY